MQENLNEKQIIHLLPRSYLKTVAALVGRDRKTKSLHVNPIYCDNLQPTKQKLSKNSAILGALLIQDWQRSRTENGHLCITNMSDLARRLKTTPQELKIFLLNLGGFGYPLRHLSHKNQSKRTLEVTEGLLFGVNFVGYNGWSSYNEDYRIGTRHAFYIKNERI